MDIMDEMDRFEADQSMLSMTSSTPSMPEATLVSQTRSGNTWGVTMPRRRLTSSVLIATTLLTACIGSPQPDPPSLDAERVFDVGTRGGEIEIQGREGAVSPPGAEIRITNLDTDRPPVTATAEPDGSFLTSIFVDGNDELRFQVRHDSQRSQPQDLLVGEARSGDAPRPLAHCLRTEPELEMSLGAAADRASLDVINDCDATVVVADIGPRTEASGVTVIDGPTEIEAGASSTITMSLDPPWGAGSEEVLVIEISSPEPDRRPVTLYVE